MIQQGERAPSFTLPGIRDGEVEEISLDDHLGAELVVLVFYPGDFNPGCSESAADLNDLDLFTMQKDLTLLAISGDSVHSHRAFADQYDIDVPLLSDLRGEVVESYGAGAPEDAGYLTRRAIVVIDHQETVEYTWEAADVMQSYDTEALREVIQSVGSDETAVARYRVGHARYMEGRRGFTRAMKSYGDHDWMMAQGDFRQACDEFDEARSEFNTAVRFSEDDEARKYYERAETKAEALWRAADWLSQSSSAFSSGQGAKAESLRSDAESPLEAARDIHEPPDPDDFPPDEDPAESDSENAAGTDRKAYLERDKEEVDTSLDLDKDAVADDGPTAVSAERAGATAGSGDDTAAVGGENASHESAGSEGQPTGAGETAVGSGAGAVTDSGSFARGGDGRPEAGPGADEDASDDTERAENDEVSPDESIDDEEIEEIAAAIEEETEAAKERQAADDGEERTNREQGQFGEQAHESDMDDAAEVNVDGAGSDSPAAHGSDRAPVDGTAAGASDDSGDAGDVGDAEETADIGISRDSGTASVTEEAPDGREAEEIEQADDAGDDGVTRDAREVDEAGDIGENSGGHTDEDGADGMDLDLDLTDPTEEAEDGEEAEEAEAEKGAEGADAEEGAGDEE